MKPDVKYVFVTDSEPQQSVVKPDGLEHAIGYVRAQVNGGEQWQNLEIVIQASECYLALLREGNR